MSGIRARFVMLIATAAVAPLLTYGIVSIWKMSSGTAESVRQGNSRIATQAADQIHQYISNNERVLRSAGLELLSTGVQSWQQSRILKDYVLDFPEFREISLFDEHGQALATSGFTTPHVSIPEPGTVITDDVYIAPLAFDYDGLPTTTMAVRLTANRPGWIVAEMSLEELWRMVDRIRIGEQGYAALLSEDDLIAHGNPDRKRLVASQNKDTPLKQAAAWLREHAGEDTTYTDEFNHELVAVAAPVPALDWTVVVEQDTSEAYAIWYGLRRVLLVVIGLALLGTLVVGWLWGRSFITRIFALTRATQAIAEGRLDERVSIAGRDEIHQLGDAFNSMADRLVQLQEDVRKQERQAMFGRIAAGLVHDLSHPIQNIGNSCRLILRMSDDPGYRETFRQTVDRELVVVKRVLEDLRNIARPIPLERFPIEVDASLREIVESMQPQAEMAGLTLEAQLGAPGAFIEGDLFALGRVYRNLIINAIQATSPGGLVAVETEARDRRVQIRVYDTGCGIPADRLGAVFEDFVTTKRRGLGLGLAISKKMVEQMGGEISVASEVGRGTTFVLEFRETAARPAAVIAG